MSQPQELWRHLFRALLRESSYLPDPIARGYVHDHVVQRFRRYAEKPRSDQQNNILWLSSRRKSAVKGLSTLKRANEGYTKPLEKILRLSYGRIGKRRRQLLATMTAPEVAADNLAVVDLVKGPAMFEDGWEPPAVVVELLKSQESHSALSRLGVRHLVKSFEPPIPAQNTWGRTVAPSRRRNIRKRWYSTVLNSLYPPLPDAELSILEGLISGTVPWQPTRRRTALGSPSPSTEGLTEFLAAGPQKGHTFRIYASGRGRPHRIARRFMRRLWRRISTLVPRISWNEQGQKHRIVWDSIKNENVLSIELDPASEIFGSKHE
ncbi:hypothetical protein PHISP_00652 [Aspergillus sp. HF37]|nr:hypothetical protein PHISP_00652 [Aspergillus sp. HF37]